MLKLSLLPLALLALFLAFGVPMHRASAADLRVVVQAQTDALNRGDLDGVMSYYDAKAVVSGNVVCLTTCNGVDQIRPSIALQINQHAHYSIESLREPATGSGTGRITVTADAIKLCGQQRVEANFTVKVADKITAQDVQFDLRDPQTAAFLACFAQLNGASIPGAGAAATGSSAPRLAPPATGDGGLLAAQSGD